MISKVRYSIIVCAFLLSVTPSLNAECWFFGDAASKTEVQQIKKRLDALEALQKDKVEVAALKEEIESLKSQILSLKGEFHGRFDDQQNQLTASKELEGVFAKYGSNTDGMSPLHSAIKAGDANAVTLLLENGADANSFEMEFRPQISITALSMAAKCNQLEIARILLGYGANLDFAPYEDSLYPLTYAAEFGSGDLVTLMIESGANFEKIKPVKELVDGIPSSRRRSETPLHIASKTGNFEAVIALVNAGIDIDGFVPSPIPQGYFGYGETPLDVAAKNLKYSDNPQNLELVKFLVSHNATRRVKKYYDDYGIIKCPVISGYLNSLNK